MKGVVFLGNNECCVKEFPDPVPGPGQVRVKMMATGICGSDLHLYHMGKEQAEKRGDRIPGHEPCGIVDSVGHGVKKVKEGDRVTVYHYLGCGYCDYCASGSMMWCREARGYGGPVDGSHADFVIADERNCVLMPDSISFIDGAFIACPGGTAYSSMQKLGVRTGSTVAVFGLGAIGQIAAQMAKIAGASFVAAVDPIALRREVAKNAGADMVLDPTAGDTGMELKKAAKDLGLDVVIETSASYEALHQAIRGLAFGGTVAFVGWSKECTGGLDFGAEAHFNIPNLIFARACSDPNRDHPRWSFARIMDTCWEWLSEGRFQCEEIVSPVVPFAESAQAYQDMDLHPENSVKLGVAF